MASVAPPIMTFKSGLGNDGNRHWPPVEEGPVPVLQNYVDSEPEEFDEEYSEVSGCGLKRKFGPLETEWGKKRRAQEKSLLGDLTKSKIGAKGPAKI